MHPEIPEYIYRGSRTKSTSVEPQTIPPGDIHRFPEGTDKVVFATWSKTEACLYALFSPQTVGSQITPFIKKGFQIEDTDSLAEIDTKIGWQVESDYITRKELYGLGTIFLYEFSSKGFQFDLEGHELWSDKSIKTPRIIEISAKDFIEECEGEGSLIMSLREDREGEIPLK